MGCTGVLSDDTMEMENERSQIKFQRTKGKGRKQNRKQKYPNLLYLVQKEGRE